MIDNYEQAIALLGKMRANLPFCLDKKAARDGLGLSVGRK